MGEWETILNQTLGLQMERTAKRSVDIESNRIYCIYTSHPALRRRPQ